MPTAAVTLTRPSSFRDGDILIVGGGIAGLTLAAALHQRGIRANLVERDPQWRALGAGLLVQANGIRALRALDLDVPVAEAGTVVRSWAFADQGGEILFDNDLEALWRDVGPSIGVARAALQRLLLRAASAVPCRLGTSITSLTEEKRRVSVEFTDGSDGAYDLVVGADGIRSVVRGLAFGQAAPTFAGQTAWRSIARVRRPPRVQFWLGDGCFFGQCPVGDGLTYGFGYAIGTRLNDPLEGRLERLRDRFAAFDPAVRQYLDQLETDDQIHCSSIETVAQESWHTRRVVLIGDAAHASSPMMGQGGCMAIEDACALVDALDTEPSIEQALDAYASLRRPRNSWVAEQSQAVAESLRLSPALRDSVLRERGRAMFQDRFSPLTSDPKLDSSLR